MLDANICRLTRIVLERETKFAGVVLLSLGKLEEACHLDQLMKEVVVSELIFEGYQVLLDTILDGKDRIPEGGGVEELLHH